MKLFPELGVLQGLFRLQPLTKAPTLAYLDANNRAITSKERSKMWNNKYQPHNGEQKAQRERERVFMTREERKARATASMNSKGLPYQWAYRELPDGSLQRKLVAYGQEATWN